MSQDPVLATVAAFGPISSADLVQCMRFSYDSVYKALKVLHHTGEIVPLPRSGGKPRAFWVAK